MKRRLKIALGFIFFLVMAAFSVIAFQNKAMAEGDLIIPVLPQCPSTADMEKYPITGDELGAKTAKNDTHIISNATISSKTYNSNVLVYGGVTLAIGTNANVTINGDLNIVGSVVIKSGTLTVNGDIIVLGTMNVEGTAKVIVNKAAVINNDNHGGALVASDYYNTGGNLYVGDYAQVLINYVNDPYAGFFIQDNACLIMDSEKAKITVNNRVYFGGYRTWLKAGNLEIINGSFTQDSTYSDMSFCAEKKFNVIMRGTNSTQRTVYFDSPADSYFTNFATSGLSYTSDSLISLNVSLTADYE